MVAPLSYIRFRETLLYATPYHLGEAIVGVPAKRLLTSDNPQAS